MRHRFAAIGFSYICGLICASFCAGIAGLCAAGVLLISVIAAELFRKRALALILFFAACGAGITGLYNTVAVEPVALLNGTAASITGTITSKNAYGDDKAIYTINADGTGVVFFSADTAAGRGDEISVTGTYAPLIAGGDYSEAFIYRADGITARLDRAEITGVTENGGLLKSFSIFRESLADKLGFLLPEGEGGFIAALALGDKSRMKPADKDAVRRCGISHYMAVSGFHLSLIAGLIMYIVNLTALRFRPKLRFALLLFLIIFFFLLYDFSASVLRSGVMLLFLFAAPLFRRKTDVLNSLGGALFVILLVQPYAACDIGLILSALGTLGIGWLAPLAIKKLRLRKKTAVAVCGTLCANLMTLPISAVFFGSVSLLAPIMTLLMLPFITAAVALGALCVIVGAFLPFAPPLSALVARGALWLIRLVGGIEYISVPVNPEWAVPWLIIAVAFVVAAGTLGKKRFPVIALAVSELVLVIGAVAETVTDYCSLRVSVLSSGSGFSVTAAINGTAVTAVSGLNERVAQALDWQRRDWFIDRYALAAVLDGENNLYAIDAIKADRTVYADSAEEYGAIGINATDGAATINAGGVIIVIEPSSEIPVVIGDVPVQVDKNGDGEYNAFYSDVLFYIENKEAR